MLIEQIIEVESSMPGLLVLHIPKTSYFQGKTKIFRGKSSSERCNAKNVAESNVLDSPDQAKSQNLTLKCKILNVFWTSPEVAFKPRGLFNWLSNLKNLFLLN